MSSNSFEKSKQESENEFLEKTQVFNKNLIIVVKKVNQHIFNKNCEMILKINYWKVNELSEDNEEEINETE